MGRIVWDEKYKVGVEPIDREHKVLFSTMNKILNLLEEEDKSGWACKEGIKFLVHHCAEHFAHEEEYMRSIDYEGYETHKRLHDNFKNQTVGALEREMEEKQYSPDSIRHFAAVCIGWVISHTLTEDLAIVGKVDSRWKSISHVNARETLEQTLVQLLFDIYGAKAKLISEQYSGQDFGKVVCYRFVYKGNKKEKKWEIILVYEEQLLLKIISEVLHTEYVRIDEMVINVSRYMSRQLLERLDEEMQVLELPEIEKESLLTHDQLVESFEKDQPSCSLLFDTGTGYFAFSARVADALKGKIGSGINNQNAMDKIHQYLEREKKEWEETKQKILIVDDSEFMRKNMARLLSEDYNVLEADSGIVAIQLITLNRPDLVLLDYEMPICSGEQLLKMIRAESTLASIPVIFLTGRGDRESVQKVMGLKPEGYLLKSTPEDELKKQIDHFMSQGKKEA